ncbi:radical SAM protein [bacterium]|nr:radical SAM protein [bacterium]
MKGNQRLYYRFRGARYYGGIATADAVGCSFLCAYCWNYYRNLNPARFHNFYSPHQGASKLLDIARKKSYRLFRISGAEPLIGESSFSHLLEVLKIIGRKQPRALFILETNGLFLGTRPDLVAQMNYTQLRVRVCLKGVDEESFQRVTGARKEYFSYPLEALREMEKQNIEAWPALMGDLFTMEQIHGLEQKIKDFGIHSSLELEGLEPYPFVIKNMKKRKLI